MDLNTCKLTLLKKLLQKRQMPTSGNKAELIARLRASETDHDWASEIEDIEPTMIREESEQEERVLASEQTALKDNSASDQRRTQSEEAAREMEFMQRERALLEREMRLLQRENELLRSASRSDGSAVSEVSPKHSAKAIGELLNDFNGTEDLFRNWEKQVRLLIATYRLDDNSAKIPIGTRLKNRALEWFHSRPEHIELSANEILIEMRKMFDHRQSKLKLRKQFEERKWKHGEAFGAYFHEKIILANRVPVEEEELLEYMIEGISNVQLKNQAKLQRFESKDKLFTAFETVGLADEKNRKEEELKQKHRVQKEAAKDSSVSNVRCYNCSKYGHVSRDCKAPKREKGSCFKCGEKGHLISECNSKTILERINCVDVLSVNNDFQKIATIKVNSAIAKYEIKIDAQIDTGSPISFVKEKIIPNHFIERTDDISNFAGINSSRLNVIGIIIIDIQCDRINEVEMPVYVVDNHTMSPSLIIGRDIIKKAKFNSLAAVKSENENNTRNEINEILSIDVNNCSDNANETLIVNPDIDHAKRLELENMFEKDYVRPERPLDPMVNAELTLKFNDKRFLFFTAKASVQRKR